MNKDKKNSTDSLSTVIFAQNLALNSPDIINSKSLKLKNICKECHGENVSPELTWSGEPEGTKSFAVTIFDPDAPTGSGLWHWVVFNIPADVKKLVENAGSRYKPLIPLGSIQTKNDHGDIGYTGPCPPQGTGTHHYKITVYALDSTMPFDGTATPTDIGEFIHFHLIEKASLEGTYTNE